MKQNLVLRTCLLLCMSIAAYMAITFEDDPVFLLPELAPSCEPYVYNLESTEEYDIMAYRCGRRDTKSECERGRACWWKDSDAYNVAKDGYNAMVASIDIVEVMPGVLTFYGINASYMAYIVAIEHETGFILINAGQTPGTALFTKDYLAEHYPTKPITHLIATHSHFDETSGMASLYAPGLHIISPAGFVDSLIKQQKIQPLSTTSLAGVNLIRNYGTNLRRDSNVRWHCELLFEGSPLIPSVPGLQWTYITEDYQTMTVGGITMQFFITPADMQSEISVYFPDINLLHAADVVLALHPPLATFRGDPPRLIDEWIGSVKKLKDLPYTMLLASSIPPVLLTEETSHAYVDYYLAFLQSIEDHVLYSISTPMCVDDIVTSYVMPQELVDLADYYYPLSFEGYHFAQLSIRGALESYVGIASSYYHELYTLPKEKTMMMMYNAYGNSCNRMLRDAHHLIHDGENDDLASALLLSEYVKTLTPCQDEDLQVRASHLMYQACYNLANKQTALTARDWLLNCAAENKPDFVPIEFYREELL